MKYTYALLLAGILSTGTIFAAEVDLSKLPPAAAKTDVTFEHDILPIFKESCVRCHGADKPKAGLRLDSAEAVLKGSKDGKVVTVGDSAKSHLVVAVARIDPETAMPPRPRNRPPGPGAAAGTNQPAGGANRPPQGPPAKPLTPEQVGLVRAWIDQGAK